MISRKLNVAQSTNGIPTWGIPFSDVSYEVKLTPTIESTLTIPENVNVAVFGYSSGASVKVQEGGITIIEPPLGVTQTTASMMPSVRRVTPGETLRLISPTSDFVNVAFYQNDEG